MRRFVERWGSAISGSLVGCACLLAFLLWGPWSGDRGESGPEAVVATEPDGPPGANPEAAVGDQTGEASAPSAVPPEAGSELPFGLRRCASDTEPVRADVTSYRDTPIYYSNEQPIEEVRAWAATQPGFEEIWIDRDRNGWLTLGFSADVEARQQDLTAQFPDDGVVAVEVVHTALELGSLQQAIFELGQSRPDLGGWGIAASVSRQIVQVDVPVLDERHLAPLAEFAEEPICVAGAEPSPAVVDGPQLTEGDG